MKEIRILLLIVSLLAGVGSVYAQPQPGSPWPMIHHDQYHTGRSPYNVPSNPTLKWTFDMLDEIRTSPVIAADSTIYIAVRQHLFAINPDGTEKWRFPVGWVAESSPAIGLDGTIYVGDDVSTFFAVNPNGTEKWTFDMGGAATWPSPTIGLDGRIYVGSMGAPSDFYALNPNGTADWSYSVAGHFNESPSIGMNGMIYIRNDDGYVYAFTPLGSIWWQYFIDFGGGGYRGSTSFSVDDSALYTGGRDLFALTPDGNLKWTFPTGSAIYAAPAVGEDGSIYFGSTDSTFYALDPSGNLKWTFLAVGQIFSSAVIDSNGIIYFGAGDRFSDSASVYALHPDDGSLLWNYCGLPATIVATPAIGVDGTLYIACFDGKLYAFGTPTTGAEERDQLRVVRNQLFQNHPNPFFASNKGTFIQYGLAQPGEVSLKVYDLTGRLVETLVDESQESGVYSVQWKGLDDSGEKVASGIYFYRLQSGDLVSTKKLILLR